MNSASIQGCESGDPFRVHLTAEVGQVTSKPPGIPGHGLPIAPDRGKNVIVVLVKVEATQWGLLCWLLFWG